MKIALTLALLFCVKSSWAWPITERFTDESDLRPYIEWIAKNTRFKDALDIKPEDLPEIFLLDTMSYRAIVSHPSLAVYLGQKNHIYVDQTAVRGNPSIILHEMIHFYQYRANPLMPRHRAESEAQEIQEKFQRSR